MLYGPLGHKRCLGPSEMGWIFHCGFWHRGTIAEFAGKIKQYARRVGFLMDI